MNTHSSVPESRIAWTALIRRCAAAGVLGWLLSSAANAATFTVVSTGDEPDANTADGVCQTSGGTCTLRAAIQQANASAGGDFIAFQFCPVGSEGSCSALIQPATPLPDLDSNLTIDGFTDPASRANSFGIGQDVIHSVFINFGSLPTPVNADEAGLRVIGNGVAIRGLVLYDADNADPQARSGVLLRGNGNSIAGCYIGTFDGFQGNGFNVGVRVEGNDNDIGVATLAGRNLITRNSTHVLIEGSSGSRPSGNIVANNYIGTESSGSGPLTTASGAGGIGVLIREADDNQVGGPLGNPDNPVARNVILTPERNAIVIDGGRRNIVQGNYVGLGSSGNMSTQIGEPTPLGASILIGQLAGTATSADDNLVGGPTAAEGNTITRGVSAGVRIGRIGTDLSSGNRILFNRIVGNLYLGIWLADIGDNDPGDADTGPNGFQNSPEIVNFIAGNQANTGDVEVRLQSTPRTPFTLQLFANSGTCYSGADFEGDMLLDTAVNVATNDTGDVIIRIPVTLPVDPLTNDIARVLTATATDPNGNTSQFSRCFDSASQTTGTFAMRDARITGLEGSSVQFVVRREGGTNGSASVALATEDITANAGSDYSGFSTRLDFADGESSKVSSVSLLRDNQIDPRQTFRVVLSSATGAALDPTRSETVVEIVDAESRMLAVTDDATGNDVSLLGVDFGEILVGATASRRVRVQNVTSLVVGITALDVTGAPGVVNVANNTCTSLAPNATCTFDVLFSPDTTASFAADVSIRYSPTVGLEESVRVRGSASSRSDLQLTKGADVSAARPGDAVTYLLHLSNPGAATASGVVVADVLPESMGDPVDPTSGAAALQPTSGTAQYDPTTRTITWSAGDIAQFAVARLSYRVTVNADATGTARNTASITDGTANDRNVADNVDSADIQFVSQASDLALSLETGTVALPVYAPEGDYDFDQMRTLVLGIVNRGPDASTPRLTIRGYGLLPLVDLTVQAGTSGTAQQPYACSPAMPARGLRGWLNEEAAVGPLPDSAECQLIAGTLAPDESLRVEVTFLAVGGAGTVSSIDFSLSGDNIVDPNPANNTATGSARILIPIDAGLFDGSGSNGSWCFIATAAYGSYLEPEVVVLRRFRDRWLLTNAPGRAFVAWYYRISPPIAAYIAKRPLLRALVRGLLTPLVYSIKYPWLAAALAFAILFGSGAGLRGRRHQRLQDPLFTRAIMSLAAPLGSG